MTLIGMIDYGLVALFFIGIAGLLFLVTRPGSEMISAEQPLPTPQNAKTTYALLGLLFALLITTAFLTQKGSMRGHSR